MKFNFKIQQYQTDAVDAVVNVFAGQPYSSGVSYIRDTGTLNQKPQQLSFLALADNPEKMELEDLHSRFQNAKCLPAQFPFSRPTVFELTRQTSDLRLQRG